MNRSPLVLLALVGTLTLATTAAAATPNGAARATRDCLRSHGWTAALSDGGLTVKGQAPRKLGGYPYRPWFSVSFFAAGKEIGYAESRMKLNRGEARVATLCLKASLR